MGNQSKLSATDIQAALAELSGWKVEGHKITKDYKFRDFCDAFAFMTRCALEIEKRDHHPEWFNVYNKLHVELTTHDAGGITTKDMELARFMDKIAATYITKDKD